MLLTEHELDQSEIARCTGIPRGTVRDWVKKGAPGRRRARWIDPADVPKQEYAYLLGLYLGDGYICRTGRTFRLRIAMDSRYPAIIEEARASVAAVLAPNHGSVQRYPGNMVEVCGYSSSLPRLFPQHGPGPKDQRPIVLESWQEEIVDDPPEQFLRGLIHSDGSRCMNKVWGGKYAYPRYFFAQVSRDIMDLFCRTCDRLGIEYGFCSRSASRSPGREVWPASTSSSAPRRRGAGCEVPIGLFLRTQ